ncbi:MAG: sigma-54 dependent transcriptional regulator [Desulfobacterium sp.]|jgi:DNA-binding NtrC family response regulator|nr:sigma-54 dependent transcriptional regulator [Desulfobacterium sp.]
MIDYVLFVIDDEKHIRQSIEATMEGSFQIKTFDTAEKALKAMETEIPDIILLDIGLPGMDGIQALEKIKQKLPTTPVIMITAYENVTTVITAMKLGAYDYILKPLQLENIEISVNHALETIRLHKEVKALQEEQLNQNMPFFICQSDAIQEVMDFVSNVSRSPDTPILILGETGTGKELIAKAIHYRSPNFRGPLISVNCSAIPNDLVESELFGYESGAFSGASSQGKQGLIESAAGGTLFLDELGDLSLKAQAKLLRFLESGEFYKVGGTQVKKASTRIVSATNQDLPDLIAKKKFRKDLYYRLGVVSVRLPQLHERQKDIIPLAKYFLDMFGRKFNLPFTGMTSELESWMFEHSWAGNVRELKNRIERAVLIGTPPTLELIDIEIDFDIDKSMDLTNTNFEITIPAGGTDITELMENLKTQYIKKALEMTEGNEAKAARLLKLNYHTLRYHCKQLKKDGQL